MTRLLSRSLTVAARKLAHPASRGFVDGLRGLGLPPPRHPSYAATSYYRGLNTSLISSVTAQANRGQNGTVSVTIKGRMTGIWPLTISETVTGPIECFRTQASQGVACG